MDLIIRNARLSTRPGDTAVDIGIENGRIAAIALAAGGREDNAANTHVIETPLRIQRPSGGVGQRVVQLFR